MNILFLVHRIPYPPNKGDKIRSFHEIKYLSKNHNLYLAFMIDDRRDISYINELREYCTDLDYDIIRPQWKKIKSTPYLFTDKPLSIPYFYSRKLQDAIDRRFKETLIDAIICFSSPMAEYVFKSRRIKENKSKIKLIVDFVDVDSVKWKLYGAVSRFPFSAIFKREWKRLMSYEKKVGQISDWSVFVSEKEDELFKSFCPQARTVVIPNGVDFIFLNGSGDTNGYENVQEQMSPNILFIGAMDYFPNEDAVLYFFYEIWPYVKENLPDAKFFVVGGKPSRRVRTLSEKDPHIMVTGYVPDVRPYFKMANIFVAPLRLARGIQNKVLEAMAAGVPVVARPEAVQGLSRYNGCIVVEDDNKRFALSILKILKIPHKRYQLVADAKRFILAKHNWEKNLSKLEELMHKEV